ncbi:hypothetical protein CQA49_09665 [Helicobacter sp. MIT 00-7814]|uniref:hypothetical protein n=1 Tax=unclassified Helicobacter TaxID=2593540 RepID=UPI000E1E5FB7|nr:MULTISPECIES: hypothetical protein [unclassified Helicobacter]RDU51400.1 hypothetical protein CQA49_09665 [Helicobacter sp. MIT 00-7814]RDU51528.1 hypothetical protein CQA37_09655 [Helicobacter sp. MIT 99-10781]
MKYLTQKQKNTTKHARKFNLHKMVLKEFARQSRKNKQSKSLYLNNALKAWIEQEARNNLFFHQLKEGV